MLVSGIPVGVGNGAGQIAIAHIFVVSQITICEQRRRTAGRNERCMKRLVTDFPLRARNEVFVLSVRRRLATNSV